MRVLLDTHILIWALGFPERLSGGLRDELADPGLEILFSAASIWEIAIKVSRGRLGASPQGILEEAVISGFTELPVRSSHVVGVATLPLHHRDPFDRLLVAQAMAEPAVLYTADRQLAAYSDLVRLI